MYKAALILVLLSIPSSAFAFGGKPFTNGLPLEGRGGSYTQNGEEIDDDSIEDVLSVELTPAQDDMKSALRLRTGGRVCLGIGIPLLVGGVATAIVATSGTVGSVTGTMAVYGVSIALLTVSIALDVTALVLLVKSGRRYRSAIEKYNGSLGAGAAVDVRLYLGASGAALNVEF
ncbi:MAG: hypothetical protein M0R80_14170 [Proteobacteria bacterium]|jgi:hypothetical protein|nr:hypothetical protein [Pseudomonadota bacterium]